MGSARSGSHMTCDMLANSSVGKNLGEVTEIPTHDTFIFCSIVQCWAKNLLAKDITPLRNYQLVNVRRRDKVAQYISWCVFRAQVNTQDHSPKWDNYSAMIPWESTKEDIEWFLFEQHIDFAFKYDTVLYYEDMVTSNLITGFKKNVYPVPHEKIVTDYELVKSMLGKYNYDGR